MSHALCKSQELKRILGKPSLAGVGGGGHTRDFRQATIAATAMPPVETLEGESATRKRKPIKNVQTKEVQIKKDCL